MRPEPGDPVFDAQRRVERRLAAAAGIEAPEEQPEAPVRFTLGDTRVVFAGTGLNPDAVMSALGSALQGGPVSAAFMSFWLGYELGKGGS